MLVRTSIAAAFAFVLAGSSVALAQPAAGPPAPSQPQPQPYAPPPASGYAEPPYGYRYPEPLPPPPSRQVARDDDGDDAKDWKWQELSRAVNARFGLNTDPAGLKKVGREALSEHLIPLAQQVLQKRDLSGGRRFLERTYPLESLAD